MENSLKSIVYLTVNTVNNKIYVGIHITENPYEFDGYYGNGITGTSCSWFKHPKYPFQRACKKYGLNAFRRYTLFVFDDYADAQKMEAQIVNEDFVNRSDTYNVALGGGSGLIVSTEIPVCQYDLEGNFIKEFRSKQTAARKVNTSHANLQNAILNKGICKGFYWSENKVTKLDVSDHKHALTKPIYIYDVDGTYVTEFPSISAYCKKYDLKISSVQHALNKGTKSHGYYVSLEKFDTFVPQKKQQFRTKMLFKYDLQGKFIEELTYEEIHKIYGSDIRKLTQAISHKYQFDGFLWSRTKEDKLSPPKEKKKRIYQYDLQGNLIKIWDSYRKCNKEFSQLREVLNGVRTHFKGFVFKYTQIEN